MASSREGRSGIHYAGMPRSCSPATWGRHRAEWSPSPERQIHLSKDENAACKKKKKQKGLSCLSARFKEGDAIFFICLNRKIDFL